MTAKALGVIETFGLIAAIEAADAAAKAANVTVLGYENARGGGRIAVKLAGDVGAVKAAVAAGSGAALRVGKLAGTLVIPRPHEEIAALVAQLDRGGKPAVGAPPGHSDDGSAPVEPAAPEPPAPVEVAPVDPVPALAEPPAPDEPAPAPEQRKPAPPRRPRQPKGEQPVTPEPGEVEG
jgi:ethanolamine utilization protein EutM